MTPENDVALEEAEQLLAHGEWWIARNRFREVLAKAPASEARRRAAFGAAKASLNLIDFHAIVVHLSGPDIPPRETWPAADAVEACLLEAGACAMLGQFPEAISTLQTGIRLGAVDLGYRKAAEPSPAAVTDLLLTHSDISGAERLAVAAVALAELRCALGDYAAAVDWVKTAAAFIGRTISVRSLQLLGRAQATTERIGNDALAAALTHRRLSADQATALIDQLPLHSLTPRARAAVDRPRRHLPADAFEAVAGLAQLSISEPMVASGQADVILDDIERALPDLEREKTGRLWAASSYHLGRLLCERAIAAELVAYKALPYDEQSRLREARASLTPKLDPRVGPLLIAAIAAFNDDRPYGDPMLLNGLVLLSDVAALSGDETGAELLLGHALTLSPGDPGLMWRACMGLAQRAANRNAAATGAFWAKMALSGLTAINGVWDPHAAAGSLGVAEFGGFIRQLEDLLRRLGRLREATEIAAIATFNGGRDEIAWTPQEALAQRALVQRFSRIDARAAIDFDGSDAAQLALRDVEDLLERESSSGTTDVVPSPGVAILTVAPAGNGVALTLELATGVWSGVFPSQFPEALSQTGAVDSLVKSLASPPENPHAPWSEPFATTWLRQVSEDIVGGLPPFSAETLVLRTEGVFRHLPFAPIGAVTPMVEQLSLLSLPRHAVAAGPITRPPRFAVLSLDTKTATKPALAVGDEVLKMEQIAGQAGVLVRAGRDATLSGLGDLLAAQATVLHIATHCDPDAADPARSRLDLGDGTTMMLGDLAGCDLSGFDLVTLAACASGRPGGAAHVAPADLLHRAGAPRVLTALWPVDDEATGILMRHIYAALFGPEALTPAAALRMAQLRTRALYPHPYYWAGFHLSALPET